jgi:hypothetical protein
MFAGEGERKSREIPHPRHLETERRAPITGRTHRHNAPKGKMMNMQTQAIEAAEAAALATTKAALAVEAFAKATRAHDWPAAINLAHAAREACRDASKAANAAAEYVNRAARITAKAD